MKLTISGAMNKRTRGVQCILVADILFDNKYGKLIIIDTESQITDDNSN